MKLLITIATCFICLQAFAGCSKSNDVNLTPETTLNITGMKLKITIGDNVFTATLYDNATVSALRTKLPLTINMKDLNANEKFFDLPDKLPSNASNPGTIQSGDLMLYGSNALVLFYKSFSTSYNYTSLAKIDNPAGLAAALGSGDKTVRFELE